MKIPFIGWDIALNKVNISATGSPRKAIVMGRSFAEQLDLGNFKLSYDSLFTLYRNSGDIYACIREWRENVGIGGDKWMDPKAKSKDAVPDPGVVFDMELILNYDIGWKALRSRIMRDLGVTGNFFSAIVKARDNLTVLGTQPMDPRSMTIVSDTHGEIIKYIQRVGQHIVEFNPEEVIHLTLDQDPNHEVWGFSPMEPIVWDARTDNMATLNNYFTFENASQPAAQYIMDEKMTNEEVKIAMKEIEAQLKGPKNAGKSFVFAGVKEIKSTAITPKDMDYLLGRKFSTEKVCAAYGVSKFALGYTENVNYSNGVEQMKKLYEGTFQPLEDLVSMKFVNVLINRIGLVDRIKHAFLPQTFSDQAVIEERALRELEDGVLTLRQYKLKTGQDITPEDEADPNIDQHIIHNGASACLLSDVGVDTFAANSDATVAQNLLKKLQKLTRKNESDHK